MLRAPFATVLVLPALLLPAISAAAAEEAPAPKIVDVRLVGAKTIAKETALFYLEIRPGDRWSEEAIRKGFRKFWDTGLVDDLRFDREEAPGGVVLVVTVTERTRISKVEFTGNRKVSNSQITEALKAAHAQIPDGATFTQGKVNAAKAAIGSLYESLGYKAAVVSFRLEHPDRPETKLFFEVDEGDQTKLDSIELAGNHELSDWWIYWNMSKLTEARWWKFWTSNDVWNRASYDEDAATIKKLYGEYGYKDAAVGEPGVEYFDVTGKTLFTREPTKERRVRLRIPIVEGEQFYFGKIRVEGATLFPEEELVKLFPVSEGELLRRSRFEEGLAAIEKRYREKGYIYVFTNPDFADREDHRVDITVKLTEGEQYKLGRIEFTGNDTTRDKVLRREMRLAEGDTLDMESFRTSLFKVSQLGYFKLADDPVDFRPNSETKTVDVTVKGEEVGRNDIQFAGGYSELDGFFGQFQFNTRNFLGNGEVFGLSYQNGKRRTYFELSYTNPWFLDKRNVLGVSLFNTKVTYSDSDRQSKGGSLVYGWGLRDFENLSAVYSYQRINATYDVIAPGGSDDTGGDVGGDGGDDSGMPAPIDLFEDPPADDSPAKERVLGTTSSITPRYSYDSRNDPFDPSLGVRFSLSSEVAGGILGGTVDFVKPELHFTLYHPLARRVTLAFNSEAGWILPYSGAEVPIFERYRLGGERSLRGFSLGSVLPLDANDHYYRTNRGSVLGGDKYMLFNFETIITVGGPFKFVLFADAGNAWFERQGARFADLRTSAGAEVRIFVPIFQAPLRFIYGVNLDPLPWEKKTDFQFTIGTNF